MKQSIKVTGAMKRHTEQSPVEKKAGKEERQAATLPSASEFKARKASAARAAARAKPIALKRGKDLTASDRALLRIAKMEKEKGRELKLAGVEYDPRTAAGQREYDVRSLGGAKGARLDRYVNLFRSRGEATKARLTACERFDDLCHAARSGLFPEPRFEPGVDVSGVSSVAEDRAAGIEALDHLKAKVGEDFHAVMAARVHMGMTYVGMERAGFGDRNALAALFVAAADAVARYFNLAGPSPMLEAARAALNGGEHA